jgi:hypothetical protein
MTDRDALYIVVALAALLLAMAGHSCSSPCYESPRGEEACPEN